VISLDGHRDWEVTSVEQFIQLTYRLANPSSWIFRGHGLIEWGLVPSIDRVPLREQRSRSDHDRMELEWALLDNFKRASRPFYVQEPPAATFSDPEFAAVGRDTLYYARAFEAPKPTINAENLRCERDAEGRCTKVNLCPGPESDADDCLGEVEPRAWSSPIYVDFAHPGE
jgi:hypothetical protein